MFTLTKLTTVSALTVTASMALTLLALVSAVTIPLALLVSAPLLFYVVQRESAKTKGRPTVLEAWRALPQRSHLEIVTDLYGKPALISHKDSTAIVYANAAAREVLGEAVVGRTLYSAEDLNGKPVCFNGRKVDEENHPATFVKASRGPVRAQMVWANESGRVPLELQAQPLFKGRGGEFSLLTFQAHENDLVSVI